ncbi:MAG: apt [Frankiales bacterium]|nr:apt [Frankiales bacterium]
MSGLQDRLLQRIVDVVDFPQPGIVFKDISPLLADRMAFAAAVDAMAEVHLEQGIDLVVGIEARGFVLAAPVAYRLGAGFVPVRKPGKLPKATHETSYDLEYGQNVLQVHLDAIPAGSRVLVVDDVLATGGTAAAAARLVAACDAELVGFSLLLELGFLDGRSALSTACPGVPVEALLTV